MDKETQMIMNLKDLLNDEQKAFEEKFGNREIGGMRFNQGETFPQIKSFLALHDQKIITAVIGVGESKRMNAKVYWNKTIDTPDKIIGFNTAVDWIKSDLQQALKKETI